MKVHTSGTPYNCEVCGKHFSGRCNLKIHITVHTAETLYKCKVCGRQFNQKDNLKIHNIPYS